jgi:hypothetical protein
MALFWIQCQVLLLPKVPNRCCFVQLTFDASNLDAFGFALRQQRVQFVFIKLCCKFPFPGSTRVPGNYITPSLIKYLDSSQNNMDIFGNKSTHERTWNGIWCQLASLFVLACLRYGKGFLYIFHLSYNSLKE